MKMKKTSLPYFSFLSSQGITTALGDTPGVAGAVLWDATNTPFSPLIKDEMMTWETLTDSKTTWHFGRAKDNTLIIGKNNRLFPTPLTGPSLSQNLLQTAKELDTTLQNHTFQIWANIDDGCLSHVNPEKGDTLCWWLPGQTLPSTHVHAILKDLITLTRKAHNLYDEMIVDVTGFILTSQGDMLLTDLPSLATPINSTGANQTLHHLMELYMLVRPGLLLSQSFTANEKGSPQLIGRPLMKTALPPITISAHDQIEAKAFLNKSLEILWEQNSS